MVTDGIALLLAFALVFAAPLLLYAMMQRETQNLPRMDRDKAEQRAKEEGKRYNRGESDDQSKP
ncbi:hypothetical protein [Haloferax sp. YSMS24]|uniref:hypothetical protein n=1 Tax=unclassified Haloferax TaxID=2625095 RepID=UPI00398D61CA